MRLVQVLLDTESKGLPKGRVWLGIEGRLGVTKMVENVPAHHGLVEGLAAPAIYVSERCLKSQQMRRLATPR